MLVERIVATLPWVGIGVIVTEVLFVSGLLIMALSLGIRIRNPLKLRREIKSVLSASTASKTFWAGFWVNAVGAVGTGLLACAGIISVFPVTSWGLMYLPLIDLVATVAIRHWAIKALACERVLS